MSTIIFPATFSLNQPAGHLERRDHVDIVLNGSANPGFAQRPPLSIQKINNNALTFPLLTILHGLFIAFIGGSPPGGTEAALRRAVTCAFIHPQGRK